MTDDELVEADYGDTSFEVNGVRLTCRNVFPGTTMQDLIKVYDDAAKDGNDFAGNPAEWPIHKGIKALLAFTRPIIEEAARKDAIKECIRVILENECGYTVDMLGKDGKKWLSDNGIEIEATDE